MRMIFKAIGHILAIWGLAVLLFPPFAQAQVYEIADDYRPVFMGTNPTTGTSVFTEFGPDKQPAFFVDFSGATVAQGRKAAGGGVSGVPTYSLVNGIPSIQLGTGASIYAYWPLPTSPVGGSMFEESLGSEIAAGTLTVGKLYKITATSPDLNHFVPSGTTNAYFEELTGTTTCTAAYKVKEVRNSYADKAGTPLPPHGTAVIWWKPGHDWNVAQAGAYKGILTFGDGGANTCGIHISPDGISNYLRIGDNTESAQVDVNWVSTKIYKVVAQWGYLVNNVAKMRIGYDVGSGIVWRVVDNNWSGTFNSGATMRALYQPVGGSHYIAQVAIFPRIVDDGEINTWGSP